MIGVDRIWIRSKMIASNHARCSSSCGRDLRGGAPPASSASFLSGRPRCRLPAMAFIIGGGTIMSSAFAPCPSVPVGRALHARGAAGQARRPRDDEAQTANRLCPTGVAGRTIRRKNLFRSKRFFEGGGPERAAPTQSNQGLTKKWDTASFQGIIRLFAASVPPPRLRRINLSFQKNSIRHRSIPRPCRPLSVVAPKADKRGCG